MAAVVEQKDQHSRFDRLWCRLWTSHSRGLLTHDDTVTPRRLYVKCYDCGFESPGLELPAPAYRVTAP